MRTAIALLLLLAAPGVSTARITTAWTYQAMYEKADLVVIAKPISTVQSSETMLLPNFRPETRVAELRTVFAISVILKGTKPANLQLRHLRLVNPHQFAVPGPSFVAFDLAQRESYLMFLSAEQGGSFATVAGQMPRRPPKLPHLWPLQLPPLDELAMM